MKRRWLVLFASAALVIILTFVLRSARQKAANGVQVQFIGMTNDPSLGPAALLRVTNQAASLIICGELTPQVHRSSRWVEVGVKHSSGLAYLQPGESYVFAVSVPASPEAWRVPVIWQRRELSRFEGFINGQHERLLELFGEPRFHRDPWVPFSHVVYSPEIPK